jgi:SAM-dependent methyltransferase
MTSTRINPGAFRSRQPAGLRTTLRRAAQDLRNQQYRMAMAVAAAGTMNWIEAHVESLAPARFRCSCCGRRAHAFRHIAAARTVAWNSACPGCDSRSRHRGLRMLLPALIAKHNTQRALHFAPEPVLRPCFDGITYETADLFLEDVTHRGIDLQRLPFADRTYDMIVCNHVLEHLPDDGIAVREIARVLVDGAIAVITVPGDFRRGETVYFTGELENGHYRDYGRDFVDRLRTVFGHVDVVDLHDFDRDESGLSRGIRPGDLAFVCRR